MKFEKVCRARGKGKKDVARIHFLFFKIYRKLKIINRISLIDKTKEA